MASKDFINSWTPGGGTYTDDGVRANSFISGSGWVQSPLMYNAMPTASFTMKLKNPTTGDESTITVPFAFGGVGGAFNSSRMTTANNIQSSKRDFSLPAEMDLINDLRNRVESLTKRSASTDKIRRVLAAIIELTYNMERINKDSLANERILKRDGFKVLQDASALPFIPSERQRMEDVIRLSQALWDHTFDFKAEEARFDEYLKRETATRRGRIVANSSKTTAVEANIIPGDASKFRLYITSSSSIEELDAY